MSDKYPKYLEEKIGRWMLFPEGEVVSDIADQHGDIACGVSTVEAKKLVASHNKLLDTLLETLSSLPDPHYLIAYNFAEKHYGG